MPRCNTNDLSSIFNFGFTHSNKVPAGAYPKNEIPVGGTINLFCEYSNERMTSDKFDDWHDDFQLTILCKPNEKFDIPIEGFPTCKSWCPAEKALPPPESGMSLAKDTDPKKCVSYAWYLFSLMRVVFEAINQSLPGCQS